MDCPSCGETTSAERRFCRECGAFVRDPRMGGRAGIWWRVWASCIEGIFLIALIGVSLALTQGLGAAGAVVSLALWGCYVVWAFVLMARGSSPGKQLTGLRVVHVRTGEPIGFWRMFFRQSIGQWVSGLVSGLGHLWAIIDADQQCWHDKLFDTLVVDDTPRRLLRGRTRRFQPAISLQRRTSAALPPPSDDYAEYYEEEAPPRRRPQPRPRRPRTYG